MHLIKRLSPALLLWVSAGALALDNAPNGIPQATEPLEPTPPTVSAPAGTFVGTKRGAVNEYLGIPYAQPPVGDNRWRAPQALAPMDDPFVADQLGAACLQTRAKRSTSEDCLTLNIWTSASRERKQPVMVWIHGGGFRGGSNDVNGQVFAHPDHHENPAVVVALNYRLGPLGFFSHKALKEKHANFGVLDMLHALTWVQGNIESFGGDPDNVTVFGVSAGAMAVNILMTTPQSAGLFHKAIAQSSYGTWPLSHTRHARRRPALDMDGSTLLRAEQLSKMLVKQVTDKRQTAATLRSLSGTALVEALEGFQLPYVDGQTLKAEPALRFAQGKQHRVPLIIGGNSNEGSVMPSSGITPEQFARGFGIDKKRVQTLYEQDFARDDLAGWQRVFGDNRYLLAAKVQGELMADQGLPVWLYYIDFVPEAFRSRWVGTPHGMDAWLLFNTEQNADPEVTKFAQLLRQYWLNFAHHSTPNGITTRRNSVAPADSVALPMWPAYTTNADEWLVLNNTPRTQRNVIADKLKLLQDRYRLRTAPARSR